MRIVEEDGLSLTQVFVKRVADLFGTLFSTDPTTDTLLFVHITGVFQDSGGKPSRLSVKINQLGQGDDLDGRMAGHLDQPWRDHTGGTIVGREGLIQAGHDSAYGWTSIEEVDEETGPGQVQGRLHSGDPPTDD